MDRRPAPALTMARRGAVATLIGILASGPFAVALVAATHPQPVWRGAAAFAAAYHPIQIIPYLGGIALVAGLVMLVVGLHGLAAPAERPRTTAGLVFLAAFATLILFNYVVQTTFVPALAAGLGPGDAGVLAAFTMANPRSLGWAVEMWGWGALGVATWLVAPVLGGDAVERAAGRALAANGPVSLTGALWTVARPGWVATAPGLALFVLWNLLLGAAAALALIALRRRERQDRALAAAA